MFHLEKNSLNSCASSQPYARYYLYFFSFCYLIQFCYCPLPSSVPEDFTSHDTKSTIIESDHFELNWTRKLTLLFGLILLFIVLTFLFGFATALTIVRIVIRRYAPGSWTLAFQVLLQLIEILIRRRHDARPTLGSLVDDATHGQPDVEAQESDGDSFVTAAAELELQIVE